MSKKEWITYILQNTATGFYVKSYHGELTLTDTISKAKTFEPNDKNTEFMWRQLYETGHYTLIKRTETTEISYQEVETVE